MAANSPAVSSDSGRPDAARTKPANGVLRGEFTRVGHIDRGRLGEWVNILLCDGIETRLRRAIAEHVSPPGTSRLIEQLSGYGPFCTQNFCLLQNRSRRLFAQVRRVPTHLRRSLPHGIDGSQPGSCTQSHCQYRRQRRCSAVAASAVFACRKPHGSAPPALGRVTMPLSLH